MRPCEAFAKLRTEEFVERFLPIIKVQDQTAINMYKRHLALLVRQCIYTIVNTNLSLLFQRLYLRTDNPQSKDKMLKSFCKWLELKYYNGKPSESDLEAVYQDDVVHDYSIEQAMPAMPPDEDPIL